jgi:uncharacterized protein (UPF0212 family)
MHILDQLKTKLENESLDYILIGYDECSKCSKQKTMSQCVYSIL